VKKDRKNSDPRFNQELLKMFQSRRKKESGRGNKQLIERIGKKRPYRCIDELNDTDDDDDEHVVAVAEESMTEAPIFVYRNTVNNYSEQVGPDIAYRDIKKEPPVYRNTVNNYSEVAPDIAYRDIKKEPV
jgi:hypothetical protein